jgi:2-polyprenyl-6-methoxyphenol hydroxylase-like FAD-dependent oxidoreductase
MNPLRVLIAGGGIGGLCLAQGLTKSGIRATVFDRDASAGIRAQGWRITLKEDGVRALRDCLPENLFDLSVATSIRQATTLALTDHQLTPKFVKPVPPLPVDAGFGVNRLTLREILLTGLDVRFGKTFERFDQCADGRVRAHFADGTTATGDLLVGAEGTNSVVRTLIAPNAEFDDLGTMIYGRSPMMPLPDILVDSFNNMTGPDGITAGIVTCRTREPAGTATARLAPEARLTEIPDYLAWTVRGKPFPAADASEPDLAGETLHRLAVESVRDWHPTVREVVASADVSATFLVTLRAARPVKPWHTTNVTLLGDAIHTMSPSRGEGANTTLRDARLLRSALAELPLAEAKARYEKDMLDYGFRAVAQSVREPLFRR